jgi:hypothetical protein
MNEVEERLKAKLTKEEWDLLEAMLHSSLTRVRPLIEEKMNEAEAG